MSAMPKIILVGCGNMGFALTRGWLNNGWLKSDIVAVDPSDSARQKVTDLGILATEKISTDPQADIIVLAVKPQHLGETLPAYKQFLNSDPVFLSIVAGKPIVFLEDILGKNAAIVRGMPNTPVSVGKGMTALVKNKMVKKNQMTASEKLMGAVGRATWLEDESLMNAVTGISGSGPAYVFLIIEALSKAGVNLGLSEELSGELALMTVAGAGELAFKSDLSPTELRRRVTSPGGTTEAALNVLMRNEELVDLFKDAAHAAADRGRDLA